MPRLIWVTEDSEGRTRVIDTTFEVTASEDGEVTQNSLVIKRLNRKHFGQTFTCLASNNNATEPVATNVTVDMRCKIFGLSLSSVGTSREIPEPSELCFSRM